MNPQMLPANASYNYGLKELIKNSQTPNQPPMLMFSSMLQVNCMCCLLSAAPPRLLCDVYSIQGLGDMLLCSRE